jgi:hypothetical protein
VTQKGSNWQYFLSLQLKKVVPPYTLSPPAPLCPHPKLSVPPNTSLWSCLWQLGRVEEEEEEQEDDIKINAHPLSSSSSSPLLPLTKDEWDSQNL